MSGRFRRLGRSRRTSWNRQCFIVRDANGQAIEEPAMLLSPTRLREAEQAHESNARTCDLRIRG
jgi:hypothetical protein